MRGYGLFLWVFFKLLCLSVSESTVTLCNSFVQSCKYRSILQRCALQFVFHTRSRILVTALILVCATCVLPCPVGSLPNATNYIPWTNNIPALVSSDFRLSSSGLQIFRSFQILFQIRVESF